MKGVLQKKLLLALIALLVVALSCALLVSCQATVYSVTADFAAERGTVDIKNADGNAATQFEEGATATITVTPGDGFEVTAFKVNGVEKTLTNGVFTLTVTEDTVITVTFTAKSVEPTTTALTAPVITKNGNVVTWTAVDHATGYEVYLNGTKKTDVTACTYTFAETAVGTYKLTVKAVSTDAAYTTSAASNEVEFVVEEAEVTPTALTAPVITKNGNVVTWTAVDHATGYEVYLNGTKRTDVTACTYTFAETAVGTYKLTVKAVSTDAAYTTSAASNEVEFVIEDPLVKLAEALTSVATTFRAEGESVYTKTGEPAELHTIVTVFGASSKSTVETNALGKILYEDILVNRDGLAAYPYHTKDNTVEYQLSKDNYADYDNPFKTLTAADFETTATKNVFKLTNADKAKTAARNVTGWSEPIDSFLVTIENGKVVKIEIESGEMHPDQEDETVVARSTYEFVLTQHGTAVVDAQYTAPYVKTADHARLEAALTKAKAAENYTWRVHEEETGYDDLNYNIFVTDGMIYIDCEGWESGYWFTNETVYPFDYTPATEDSDAVITLLDALTDRTFATVRATFIDSAFHAELFECVDNNTFVLRDTQNAGDLAFYFADGRDNQKLYLGYALDLTITLNADGDLDTVVLNYFVYGAYVERTLTLVDVDETTIDIDIENASIDHSSILDAYIGEYESVDKGHSVVITDEGITIDGEEFVVEMYSAANGIFVGTINGEKYYIENLFQKQLIVYNEVKEDEEQEDEEQEEDNHVQFVVTNVDIEVVDIPDRYKGIWVASLGEDSGMLVIEVLNNTINFGSMELTVLSYDDYNELIAMDSDGWTYAFWKDIDKLPENQMYFVIYVDGAQFGYIVLYRINNLSESELPDELVGEYVGSDEDGAEYVLTVTENYITLIDSDGILSTALVLYDITETEDGKQVVTLYSAIFDAVVSLVVNGDGTYLLGEVGEDGELSLWAAMEKIDPNAIKIPASLQGEFENEEEEIRVVITNYTVTLFFEGVEQDVVIKELVEGESFYGNYWILVVTIDGVEYELGEDTDTTITIWTQEWGYRPILLTRVTKPEPDPDPNPGDITIPDAFIGCFADEDYAYVVTITKDGIGVMFNLEDEIAAVITAYDDYEGFTLTIDGKKYYIYQYGYDESITKIVLLAADGSVMKTLDRVDEGGDDSVTIPEKFIGGFANDTYQIVITADDISVYVDGEKKTVKIVEYSDDEGFTVTIDGDEYYIYQYGYDESITKIVLAAADRSVNEVLNRVAFTSKYYGTFQGTDGNDVKYVVVIDETGVYVTIGNGAEVKAIVMEAEIEEEAYEIFTLIVGDEEVLIMIYATEDNDLSVVDAIGYSVGKTDVELTRVTGGGETENSVRDTYNGTFSNDTYEIAER